MNIKRVIDIYQDYDQLSESENKI